MANVYIRNFNYVVFVSFTLLILVVMAVSGQGRTIRKLEKFEKYLVIKHIISLDSLITFENVEGVALNRQQRKMYRKVFVPNKTVLFSVPVKPVNTKFLETNLIGYRGLVFRCTCDSNGIRLENDSLESRRFLTYKIIVYQNDEGGTGLQFPGFVFYVTNTNLISEQRSGMPCLQVGKRKIYLESWVGDPNPYESIVPERIEENLFTIKKENRQDTLNDEEFYVNTLVKKSSMVKIPLLDLDLDTRRSRNFLCMISIGLAAFSLNMFRQSRKRCKGRSEEPFLIFDTSKDISRWARIIAGDRLLGLRLDSVLILLYYFIAFLSPLIILFLSLKPSFEGENTLGNEVLFLIIAVLSFYFTLSLFYNYLLLFTEKRGFKAVREMFLEERDTLLSTEPTNKKVTMLSVISNVGNALWRKIRGFFAD